MAEDSKTYVFGGESQVPAWLAYNNGNNGFLGGNGLAGGALGFLLGLVFGNGWGGFGGFGNGGFGAGAAASLGAQADRNNNTDLIMNAINGTDADVRQLATMANTDFDSMKNAIATLNTGLATLSGTLGMSSLQIVNAIQSGDASLSRQLCECCCENRLLTTQQGYESQLRTVEQTNTIGTAIADLKSAMIDQFCASEKRDMQNEISTKNEIISTLKSQIDNANQTAQIAALLAPIKSEVELIKASQPNTVPVQWPNLIAVNSTPYSGYGFNPYGYGYNGSSYWG
jgi:hypothetical protein